MTTYTEGISRVFSIGTRVNIDTNPGRLNGIIDQVCIAKSGVTYQIVYWDRSERKTAWLDESEFTTVSDTPATTRIGFK